MEESIKIESKRIVLRTWQDNDVDDLVEGINNIQIYQNY